MDRVPIRVLIVDWFVRQIGNFGILIRSVKLVDFAIAHSERRIKEFSNG
jgi:hypothetical protein